MQHSLLSCEFCFAGIGHDDPALFLSGGADLLGQGMLSNCVVAKGFFCLETKVFQLAARHPAEQITRITLHAFPWVLVQVLRVLTFGELVIIFLGLTQQGTDRAAQEPHVGGVVALGKVRYELQRLMGHFPFAQRFGLLHQVLLKALVGAEKYVS